MILHWVFLVLYYLIMAFLVALCFLCATLPRFVLPYCGKIPLLVLRYFATLPSLVLPYRDTLPGLLLLFLVFFTFMWHCRYPCVSLSRQVSSPCVTLSWHTLLPYCDTLFAISYLTLPVLVLPFCCNLLAMC